VTSEDVIFPAFAAAYAVPAFVWPVTLGALLSEIAVFRFRERRPRFVTTSVAVLLANVLSWLVGLVLTSLLPDGFVSTVRSTGVSMAAPGPLWPTYAAASWPLAWVLSCAIEYGALFPLRVRLGFTRLLGTVVLANVTSYAVLLLALWALSLGRGV
jgi:hypothetical protein